MHDVDYELLARQVEQLFATEDNLIAGLANFSALFFHELADINWLGFYLIDNEQLVLGPFQGKLACTRISIGQGVCGTSAAKNMSVRVDDVHQFAGHIACDSASNSELVIPFRRHGQVIGVLDIDSPSFSRFTEIDQDGLEKCLNKLENCLFA